MLESHGAVVAGSKQRVLVLVLLTVLLGLANLFGWPGGGWAAAASSEPRLELTTDRPVYKPGEQVTITIFLGYSNGQPAPGVDLPVQVDDPQGGLAFVAQETTDGGGRIVVKFTPRENAKLGTYRIYTGTWGLRAEAVFNLNETSSSGSPAGVGGGTASTGGSSSTGVGTGSTPAVVLDAGWAAGLAAGQRVPVSLPSTGGTLRLLPEAREKLNQQGKEVLVSVAGIGLLLPPGSLAPVSSGDLNIALSPLPPDDSGLWAARETHGLEPAGAAVDVEVEVAGAGGEAPSLGGEVYLEMPYNPDAVADGDLNLLSIYRWQPETGTWEYRGGEVKPLTNSIGVWLDSLSRYAVMVYRKTFVDMESHWANNDVTWLAARQIVKGVEVDNFAPERSITRAEFTSLLVRSLGLRANQAMELPFKDVQAGAWFHQEVAAAYEAGLIKGVAADSFAPGANITRQEMGVLLARAVGNGAAVTDSGGAINLEQEDVLLQFADVEQVALWARGGLSLAVSMGIIRGTPENRLLPINNAKRAEAAAMLRRFLTRS